QQAGHAAQVVEGDVSGGPVNGTVVSGAQAAEDVDQPGSSAKVSAGGCCFIRLGGVAVEAAGAGGVTERGLVARLGVVGGCGPECRRGELIAAVAPAVLVEVVREPVHRPAPRAPVPPAPRPPA